MNQVTPTIRTVCQFVGTDIGQTVPVVEFGRTSAKSPQFKKNVALNNDNFYLSFPSKCHDVNIAIDLIQF